MVARAGRAWRSQWPIQDFITEGYELSGGLSYPLSKTENSSPLVNYFWEGKGSGMLDIYTS